MPYVEVWVDEPSLSKLDDTELSKELESRGYHVTKAPLMITDQVRHYIACGLIDQAKEEAWSTIQQNYWETAS